MLKLDGAVNATPTASTATTSAGATSTAAASNDPAMDDMTNRFENWEDLGTSRRRRSQIRQIAKCLSIMVDGLSLHNFVYDQEAGIDGAWTKLKEIRRKIRVPPLFLEGGQEDKERGVEVGVRHLLDQGKVVRRQFRFRRN
ncbi:hypothetical protein E4U61_002664 [Claviceps capensis]|nr:hypothetical protein E4U61_002664 [Claviceps capensis]